MMIYLKIALFVMVILCLFILHIIYKRRMHIWLMEYLFQSFRRKPQISSKPRHILFCFVDHYEPGWGKVTPEKEIARVDAWVEKYPEFASNFNDSDGYHPRHTWFYPPHYFRESHILKLIKLCKLGFGEIEMHLHHNRMEPFPDTSNTLRKKIEDCIDLYSRYGIFKTEVEGKPRKKYAFIHGDWALDNSRAGYCGVNDELTILQETGCYGDFTFPAYMVDAQPKMVNSIYYATDDPEKPKSYDIGQRVCVGGSTDGTLMMIQGCLGIRWKGRKRFLVPSVDDGEIAGNNPPTKDRIDFWVKTGIHIKNRPEWIVVKVFTHGAPEREHKVLLGEPIRKMHSYLQSRYNDGINYQLHYVTARELYNIIKAVEAGESGNPGDYRNYKLSPYIYSSKSFDNI